jgi:hypothetical protein
MSAPQKIHEINPACPGDGCIFCVRDDARINSVPFAAPVNDAKCVFCLDTVEHSLLAMLSCGHTFWVPCLRDWMAPGQARPSPYCPTCQRPSLYECGHTIQQRPATGNWSLAPVAVEDLDIHCNACGFLHLPNNAAKTELWTRIDELQSQEIPRLERIINDRTLRAQLRWAGLLDEGLDPALAAEEQAHLAVLNEYVAALKKRSELRAQYTAMADKDPAAWDAHANSNRLAARW